jgi:hypothetical protein
MADEKFAYILIMEKLRKKLEAYLELDRVTVTPQKKNRVYKINEKKLSNFKEKKAPTFHDIFDYLDVENSVRYKREPSKTFCNVYTCDFCSFTWAYLPRVYWNKKSFSEILKGKKVEANLLKTVHELSANMLYDFLVNEGEQYHNWEQVKSPVSLQQLANEGHVCIIVGKHHNPSKSGHITIVSPEHPHFKMKKRIPVQSQAGINNFKYKTGQDWFLKDKYCHVGFFVNKRPKDIPFKKTGIILNVLNIITNRVV